MADDAGVPEEGQEELAPFKIELARSSRSKCKSCRRAIQKDSVRFGVLVDGRFGPGFMWHHINCAAKHRLEEIEEAYSLKCFEGEVDPPPIDKLRAMAETAERKKDEKKLAPYAELAPTGRSKCRHCDKLIEKGAYRVAVLRAVEFFGQVRSGPINLHAKCVAGELEKDDCTTEVDGFFDNLKENSTGLDEAALQKVCDEIGSLDGAS